jgi:hypothetical protein
MVPAPEVVEKIEQQYQQKIAFARNLQDHWAKVRSTARKVQSDQRFMARLEAEVTARMQKLEDAEP